MDLSALASTLLGGALAIGGGYIAVVVGEQRRREADRDERLRVLRRAVLADTRDYMLALLDISLSRVLDTFHEDASNAEAIDWPGAARRPRIDRGYVGDAQLLADFLRVTNRLIAIHTSDLSKTMAAQPFSHDDVRAYTELRARLTRTFVDVETAIERGDEINVLSAEVVREIEQASPLADHLQFVPGHDSSPTEREPER